MLTQFRLCFPRGGLISEFVTIDHGKYIVKVSAQVDGVILATGLAAGDTIEEAEDKARNRALALLDLSVSEPKSPPSTVKAKEVFTPPISTDVERETPELKSGVKAKEIFTPPPVIPAPETPPKPPEIAIPEEIVPETKRDLTLESPPLETVVFDETEELKLPIFEDSSQDSLFSTAPQAEQKTLETTIEIEKSQEFVETKTEAKEPIDFSDVIAQTSVEMKRLGWTNEMGREYVLKTYGKRSRQVLTDEELLEFLEYLKSQ